MGILEKKHNSLTGLKRSSLFLRHVLPGLGALAASWWPLLWCDGGVLGHPWPWRFLVKNRMPFLSHPLNLTLTHSWEKKEKEKKGASNHELPRVKTWQLSLISPLTPTSCLPSPVISASLMSLKFLSSFSFLSHHPMQAPIISCLDCYNSLQTGLPQPGSLLFPWQCSICNCQWVTQRPAAIMSPPFSKVSKGTGAQLWSLSYFPWSNPNVSVCTCLLWTHVPTKSGF